MRTSQELLAAYDAMQDGDVFECTEAEMLVLECALEERGGQPIPIEALPEYLNMQIQHAFGRGRWDFPPQ